MRIQRYCTGYSGNHPSGTGNGTEKIRFMLSAQVNNGGGLPLVKFTHTPGKEDTPDDASYVQETGHPAYRADDALWLFPNCI